MTITAADLRGIDLFDDVDDKSLEEWAALAQPMTFAPGEVIAEPTDDPRGLVLLLDGTAEALMIRGNSVESAGRHIAPTWMGAIAVLTGGPLGARMQAVTECHIGLIEADDFRRLAFAYPMVHRRVMQQVAPVMSRISGIEFERERLASLGTMAAGLAHELNNPAAAAQRAAAQLAEALDTVNATMRRFVEAGIERGQAQQLLELHDDAIKRASTQTALDALDAADCEDVLRDRLEELGVPDAWQLVEPLAAAGLDQAWLERLADVAGPATEAALRWVAATLAAHSVVGELQESTARMSALVGAVKSYAYMDRGALVEADVHEGLETTLAVLAHKLKRTTIAVERDYDRSLPRLMVRGSELNQVWTNLLDNAIDALDGDGTITIATRRDGDCAEIEIADDGPGIPDDVQERIFDPFFTTKDVGRGTGLGLATARRIVVDSHSGSLNLESTPGRTVFTVRLPLPDDKQRTAP